MEKKGIAIALLVAICGCACLSAGCKIEGQQIKTYGINDFSVDTPADEILAALKQSDYVIAEDCVCTHGFEYLKEFRKAVDKGKAAVLKFAHYYTLDPERVAPEYFEQEKDSYPQISIGELRYDGEYFYYTVRMSYESEPDPRENGARYKFFKYEHGEKLDHYYLVDNESVTMDDIMRQIYSSQILEHYDRYAFVMMIKNGK